MTTLQPAMSSLDTALFALGVCLLLVSGWLWRAATMRRRAWVPAQGIVVALVVRRDQGSDLGASVLYAPVVDFRVVGTGATVRFEEPVASSPATHKVGDDVAILFNPLQPSQACIDSMSRRYAPALLVFSAGALLVLVAATVGFH